MPWADAYDEFAAIAGGSGSGAEDRGDGFAVVSRNAPLFRAYNIKLLTAWQDLGQAQRIFGDGMQSFIANAGVFLSFAPQDIITAEHISKLSGQTTRQVRTTGQSHSASPGQPMGTAVTDSSNINLVPMPLMLAQDARNLDPGFAIIFSNKSKGPVRSYLPYPVNA
jgi:type IV secretory pathway TraG/TraD family ATPase VirD4